MKIDFSWIHVCKQRSFLVDLSQLVFLKKTRTPLQLPSICDKFIARELSSTVNCKMYNGDERSECKSESGSRVGSGDAEG